MRRKTTPQHELARRSDGRDSAPSRSKDWNVQIIRSTRREKTVSARLVDEDTVEIRAPKGLSEVELQELVQRLLNRISKKQSQKQDRAKDEGLETLASQINKRFFGGKLRWSSIRYVSNQQKSFGSCSPAAGTIRISDRLAQAPEFVQHYIVLHELAHLVERNHSAAFWKIVRRYDKTERAIGYLIALQMEDDRLDESNGEAGE